MSVFLRFVYTVKTEGYCLAQYKRFGKTTAYDSFPILDGIIKIPQNFWNMLLEQRWVSGTLNSSWSISPWFNWSPASARPGFESCYLLPPSWVTLSKLFKIFKPQFHKCWHWVASKSTNLIMMVERVKCSSVYLMWAKHWLQHLVPNRLAVDGSGHYCNWHGLRTAWTSPQVS